MAAIRVSHSLGVPIYRQIVEQIEFMIEAGQLQDGDRLPSSRMLASNLNINRNTVAHAYRELRDRGDIEARSRTGMVVTGASRAREKARARDQAREAIAEATQACVALGLSAAEISSMAYHYGLQAERLEVRIAFVECNRERADYFARELADRVGLPVQPLVLGECDPQTDLDADLVLTTFFHLAEVRRLAAGHAGEVVAIVVAPHVRTLVELANVPKGRRVGILYSSTDQAQSIRDSLLQTGLHDIEVLEATAPEQLASVDVVVVPSEMPGLRASLDGSVQVIEFGNVLDEASTRMVREVVDDLRDRKAKLAAAA